MKKVIIIVAIVCVMLAILCACGNKDIWDTNYSYDYAIVSWPDGTVKEIEIKQWTDYEDGEQIQIKDTDGNIYLVSSFNCVLVNKEG